MAYPTSLDSFTNPTSTQTLNSPSHSGIETAQNTALTAVEAKVGITGSAVTSSLDYQVTNAASSNPGHKHTFSSLSDFTVSGSVSGDILQYNGTKYVNVPASNIPIKFGGTGADGALSITSGTTTIDLGGAAFVIKNYTSISITSSGSLSFSNPAAGGTYIVLKSQGNVTMTSSGSISTVGMGASASTAGVVLVGTRPAASANKTAGTAASGYGLTSFLYPKFVPFIIGGGGAGASGGGAGVGGRGAGALYIECGGALNFTTGTITALGQDGTVVSTGGGGGGGGSSIVILYNTLTASSGTISVAGGAGGVGSNFDGGGGGGSTTAGVAGGTGSGLGGAGGDGFSLVTKNTEFA
jgi:hypothetical protein